MEPSSDPEVYSLLISLSLGGVVALWLVRLNPDQVVRV